MNHQPSPVDLLAVGAHPDDIELTCGGLLVKLVEQGRSLGLCDLTRGEMGTRGTPEERFAEAEAAARVMGASFRVNLDLGDGHVAVTEASRAKLAAVIRTARPAFLFASYTEDAHPDHGYGGRLALEAAHLASKARYQAQDVPATPHTVRQVFHYMGRRHAFAPTFIADVSSVFERKKKAAWCYRSQHFDPQNPDNQGTFIGDQAFERFWVARHVHFGAQIGVAYGEPFWLTTPPPLGDPFLLWPGR